jgi:metal-dependent HD superfamily phosphatase/phosphodiesterase
VRTDALQALIAARSAGKSLTIDAQLAALAEAFDLAVGFLADVKRIAEAMEKLAACRVPLVDGGFALDVRDGGNV